MRDNAYAALALLNSTLVRLELERTCNVLGGGALKCEAVSLRKLRLPMPHRGLLDTLALLGRQLAESKTEDDTGRLLGEIDYIIAREVMGANAGESALRQWQDELELRLRMRNR